AAASGAPRPAGHRPSQRRGVVAAGRRRRRRRRHAAHQRSACPRCGLVLLARAQGAGYDGAAGREQSHRARGPAGGRAAGGLAGRGGVHRLGAALPGVSRRRGPARLGAAGPGTPTGDHCGESGTGCAAGRLAGGARRRPRRARDGVDAPGLGADRSGCRRRRVAAAAAARPLLPGGRRRRSRHHHLGMGSVGHAARV
ncbi:MAG: hypothetical protein AVDCRST_MAG21-447, partial [uncultured Nocardioidaceae bacterium]